jgi:hypothetical protein
MKNKATVYILGLVVVAVWGLIIYNVIKATSGDDDTVIPTSAVRLNKEPLNDFAIKEDTVKLNLNYRDPFGIASPPKDTAVSVPTKISRAKSMNLSADPIFAKAIINWTFIKYSGYIRNPHTKKLIAIVNINGKSLMMSEGDAAEQVTLLKNLKDSIKVSYQHKTKYIVINTNTP